MWWQWCGGSGGSGEVVVVVVMGMILLDIYIYGKLFFHSYIHLPTPTRNATGNDPRICYANFVDRNDANIALHLTNVTFMDRALVASFVKGKSFFFS